MSLLRKTVLICKATDTYEICFQAVLDGASALFCGSECANDFSIRSSGRMLRTELFQLERGVCQMCKLDCHKLYNSLK